MLEGHFDGKTHILPVRVYYEDTDFSGFVYHANYLRYMERGRSEYFRAAGITKLAQLEDAAEPTAWSLSQGQASPIAARRGSTMPSSRSHTALHGAYRRAASPPSRKVFTRRAADRWHKSKPASRYP